MKSVFLLWHTHELPDQREDSKLVGVYDSRDASERARKRVSKQPGFAEHPDGFFVEKYELGKDYWTEGFVTAETGQE